MNWNNVLMGWTALWVGVIGVLVIYGAAERIEPYDASQGAWNTSMVEGDGERGAILTGESYAGPVDNWDLYDRVGALEVEVEKLSELALMQSDLILKLTIKLCDGGDTE